MENKLLITFSKKESSPLIYCNTLIFYFPENFHKFYLSVNLFSISIIGIGCLFTDISFLEYN